MKSSENSRTRDTDRPQGTDDQASHSAGHARDKGRVKAEPAEKTGKADKDTSAKASEAPAAWPFKPGSQGDHKAIETRPVQRAGWNARQFRI